MNLSLFAKICWSIGFWTCLLVVLFLALTPVDPNMPDTGWDKLNHLLAFAFLFILGRQSYPGNYTSLLIGLLCYGVMIEILQSLTSYRSAEWEDLMADSMGLIVGWGAHNVFTNSRPAN